MNKRLLKLISFVAFPSSVYYTYNSYKSLNSLSNFEIAASKLGFKSESEHEALLKKFQLAGYFKPTKIWEDLNRIGQIKNPEKAFNEIYKVIKKSKADVDDPKEFDVKYMCKHLFNSNYIDVQDSMDLIVYMAQHAFNRKPGQERNELTLQDWMIKYKAYYFEQAKIFGLIDRKLPIEREYDFAWVAGAGRADFLSRIIDFYYNFKKYNIKINGEIYLLAGNRELWANVDGINPILYEKLLEKFYQNDNIDLIPYIKFETCVNEGSDYILYLADKYNIKLNSQKPLIQYKTSDECPPGRFTNRLYPNYDFNEKLKIDETLMARDMIEKDLQNKIIVSFVDTKGINTRPTTATTARDAIEECIEYIKLNKSRFGSKKEFKILFESNNPYIERQTLTSQQEVDKVLKSKGLDKEGYKFKIEGIGYACKYENIPSIHSEFGALVTEKWKIAVKNEENNNKIKSKRDIKDLLYQSRNNSISVAEYPKNTKFFLLYNFENCLFDNF